MRAEHGDHCHALGDRLFERSFEVGDGFDFNDVGADGADGLVVGEALVARHDHAVGQAVGEGQAHDLHRIIAGDAGGGGERQGSGAATGDDPPLGAGEFGDAATAASIGSSSIPTKAREACATAARTCGASGCRYGPCARRRS